MELLNEEQPSSILPKENNAQNHSVNIKNRLNKFLNFFKKLSTPQRFSLILILGLIIFMPISIISTLYPKVLFLPKAAPATPVTPSVTITISPKPTIVGNIPTITTQSLAAATVYKNYSASVEGSDKDLGDILTLKAYYLPQGVALTKCRPKTTKNSNIISCYLSGKPSQQGNYSIRFEISDNKGMGSIKYLTLVIK